MYCTVQVEKQSKRTRAGSDAKLRRAYPLLCAVCCSSSTHYSNYGYTVPAQLHYEHTRSSPIMAAPPPQGFPYDNLFKILIIGDAATGKVRGRRVASLG